MDVLIGAAAVLLGTIIAGGFGLLAPQLQARHDHTRWLREARLTAYSDFLAASDLWMQSSTTHYLEDRFANPELEPVHDSARQTALEDEVSRAQSRVVLLGPDTVRFVASDYHTAALERIIATQQPRTLDEAATIDLSELVAPRGVMLGVMNRILGISPS